MVHVVKNPGAEPRPNIYLELMPLRLVGYNEGGVMVVGPILFVQQMDTWCSHATPITVEFDITWRGCEVLRIRRWRCMIPLHLGTSKKLFDWPMSSHAYNVMLAVSTPVLCNSMNAFFAGNQLTTVTLNWRQEKNGVFWTNNYTPENKHYIGTFPIFKRTYMDSLLVDVPLPAMVGKTGGYT